MKKIRIIGAILLVAILISFLIACRGTGEVLESSLGFSIKFPASWQGKWASASGEDWVEIYHKEIRETYNMGMLFTIDRSTSSVDDFAVPTFKLGSKNGYYYYMRMPSDLQSPIWDDGNKELADEYASMAKDVAAIRKSIKFGTFTPSGPGAEVNENSPTPPSLYYTSSTSEKPIKAMLGTYSWSWGTGNGKGQETSADYLHPFEQMKDVTEYLVVSSSQSIELSVEYDDADNIFANSPRILSIGVNLVNDHETEQVASAWGDSVDTFSFIAPEQEGEYIYSAWVEYAQGSVSYSMKIKVENPPL